VTKMKKIMFLALVLTLLAVLTMSVSAFSPPSPFPVVVQVIMGGEPVSAQTVVVEILDSETKAIIDRDVFSTDGSGLVLFDLGNFKGCSTYERDGSCYAGSGRNYAGDDLKFIVVYENQRYEEVRNIEELRLQIGVDPKTQRVLIADSAAPIQIIETEVVVIEEVVVEEIVEVVETVYVCSDGSEVLNVNDCSVEDGIFLSLIELVGIVLAAVGVTWRAGYIGLAKYWWKKGQKGRALKMLATAVRRGKEDYYKKK